MARYNINDFYLGILHIGYKKRPFGEYNQEFYVADEEYLDLKIDGAIDLDKEGEDFSREGYGYKRLFTIFLHLHDDEFLCLHNRNVYTIDGLNYYSDLDSLKKYLPKMGFVIKDGISVREALSLFDSLFDERDLRYTNTRFPICNFYLGKIDICDKVIVRTNEYPYKKYDSPMNVPESMLLLPRYRGSGYTYIQDGNNESREYFFSSHDSIFYVQNNVLYSLDSHQVYSPEVKSPLDPKVRLDCAFEEWLIDEDINYRSPDITLKKVKDFRKKYMKK